MKNLLILALLVTSFVWFDGMKYLNRVSTFVQEQKVSIPSVVAKTEVVPVKAIAVKAAMKIDTIKELTEQDILAYEQALSIGVDMFTYETPNGVFITRREWVVKGKSYRTFTNLIVDDFSSEVDVLNGYLIYSYSPEKDLFLVREIEKTLLVSDQRSIMGQKKNIYTFDYNSNEFKLQLDGKLNVNWAKFEGDEISYHIYNTDKILTQQIN